MIYIDLDKRRYRIIKSADQSDNLIKTKTTNTEGIKYLFIDEVQNVDGNIILPIKFLLCIKYR